MGRFCRSSNARADHVPNSCCLLEMIKLVSFDPSICRFHNQLGVVVIVGKICKTKGIPSHPVLAIFSLQIQLVLLVHLPSRVLEPNLRQQPDAHQQAGN